MCVFGLFVCHLLFKIKRFDPHEHPSTPKHRGGEGAAPTSTPKQLEKQAK